MAIRGLRVLGFLVATLAVGVPPVTALQELGQFRWQFVSFCNVVTLSVVQEGSTFALAGFDDNCGGSHLAAFGTASFNPDGTAGMGLTVVTRNGAPDHFDITIDLATLHGTWHNDAGTTGTFVFNPPASPSGAPRPSRSTLRGVYNINFIAASGGDTAISAFSFGVTLPSAPTVNFILIGGASTANCPGTAANPQAAPGHLCVYERARVNVDVSSLCALGTTLGCNTVDPFGASVFLAANAAGQSVDAGTWALTPP